MKCAVPLKLNLQRKMRAAMRGKIHSGKMLWVERSTEANCGPLKGEKDDVYRAVRTINAIDSFKVMPVRYKQFLVANKHRCM